MTATVGYNPTTQTEPYNSARGKTSKTSLHLCLLRHVLVRLREAPDVLLDQAVLAVELHVGTVHLDTAFLAQLDVLLTAQRREAPVLRHNDLLATRELVHGAAQSLDSDRTVGVTGADRQKDLADVHTSHGAVGLAEGTTHTGLETIGTSAR